MIAPFPSHALIRRELLVTLRKVRMIVFAALVVLACMAGVWAVWPYTAHVRMTGAGIVIDAVTGATQSARASAVLLDMMSLILMASCGLFLPGVAAVAISSERDQDTYDLLHLSLITPRGMAFGKLVNALGVYALLAMTLLPVVGVIFFIVGVSWQDLFVRAGLLGLMALATASVGLHCSARFQHTAATMAMAYVGALFAFGIPYLLLYAFLSDILHTRLPGFLGINDELVPIAIPPLAVVSMAMRASRVQAIGAAIHLSLFSAFFFWRTLRVLRRPPKARDVRQEKIIDDAAILEARRKRFPYYLIDPLKRKKTIEDGRNPVLVRELRWGMLGRMTVMVRVFYVALAVDWTIALIFLLANIGAYRATDGAAIAMAALIACTCLPAPILLASLLAKEREQGNLEMLRMTLVRPREILMGKLGAALMHLAPLVSAAALASVIVVGAFGLVCWEFDCILLMAAGLVTLAVCVWVVAAASLAVSLLARRTASALVASYALALLLLLGLSFAAHLIVNASYNHLAVSRGFLRLCGSSLSPFLVYMELAGREWARAIYFWAVSSLGFVLLGVLLFAFCLYVFNRRPAPNKG